MEANEEINKMAGADKVAQQDVQVRFDQEYENQLKKDQDAYDSQLRGESVQKFDEVRKLGFATHKDIEKMLNDTHGKYIDEVKALKDELTKFKEWVMRAKAHGLTGGALDQKDESNEVSDYLKPFMRGRPNR